MLEEGTYPNQGVLVTVLKACSDEADLHFGKLVHFLIVDSSFGSDTIVSNTLIHLYAICGSLEDACMVFQTMSDQNEATWTSIISGFAHGIDVKSVALYLLGMKSHGFKPNDVTFICLLMAYSNAGRLGEACEVLNLIIEEPNVNLTVEHYNCVVDLFGRQKMLDQAKELLVSMPFHFNIVGWKSLLGHCKTFGDVKLGRECFHNITAIDAGNAFAHTLMVEIYKDAEMWEDVNQLYVK
jgi:pentatricopeptide repeat protein